MSGDALGDDLCQVALSIGTNHQRDMNLVRAFDALFEHFGELTISSVYESCPVDDVQSPNYYNAVACFMTNKSVSEIQTIAHAIEADCGRDRSQPLVTMDIDLLLYGDQQRTMGDGHLPHNDIVSCAYVLRPLSECLPANNHPLLEQSFQHLWEVFCASDHGQVLEPIDFIWRDQVVSVSPPCLII